MGFLSGQKGTLGPRPSENLTILFIAIGRYPARAASKLIFEQITLVRAALHRVRNEAGKLKKYRRRADERSGL
jgi:hypothetical protein